MPKIKFVASPLNNNQSCDLIRYQMSDVSGTKIRTKKKINIFLVQTATQNGRPWA